MITSHDEQFFKIPTQMGGGQLRRRTPHAAGRRRTRRRSARPVDGVGRCTCWPPNSTTCASKQDVTQWTDAQLVRWLKDLLGNYLFQLRSLTGDAARPAGSNRPRRRSRRLKAENAQLSQQNLLMPGGSETRGDLSGHDR